jgi:hypothetical protein
MPRRDGTGPYGDSRPGRGMGSCGRSGTSITNKSRLTDAAVGIFLEIIRALLDKRKKSTRR